MTVKKGTGKLALAIFLIVATSIAANTSQSQTKDTVPTRSEQLIKHIKVLNTIEAQEKEKKERLYTGLDSSIVDLKNLARGKDETGKVIDNTRWLIKQLNTLPIKPRQKDSLMLLLPRVELYDPPVSIVVLPEPSPEAALERSKKKNWFYRIFNFL